MTTARLQGHSPSRNAATSIPRDYRLVTTTNFEGAWQPGQSAKWLDQYNRYFAGRRVAIFEDNDDSGRAWSSYVAGQVAPLAVSVKVIRLSGLPEKGDVSDWLESHTAEELIEAIRETEPSQPQGPPPKRELLVSAEEFLSNPLSEIDWLVDGVIERGSNGFIAAAPKVGKSFLATDLVLSLAAGKPWLGFAVKRPVRCAYVSREDFYRTTQRRLERLY